MKHTAKRLKEITDVLLSPELNYSAVKDACSSLFDFYCSLSGFDTTLKKNQEHVATRMGVAVSPYAAAFCIIDMMRTRNFLQGIKKAIDTKLKENPGRPVIVLYAGTGPFATLLTPLTTRYKPSQLQLVLIDINPVSLAHLAAITDHLNLHPFIIDMAEADAATYIIPENQQPDIVVSETMMPGLKTEPQLSVTAGLLAQCKKKVIMIPGQITTALSLVANYLKDADSVLPLHPLLELNAATALQINNNPETVPVISSGFIVTLFEKPDKKFCNISLHTTIRIFGDCELKFRESNLTLPQPVMDIEAIREYPCRIHIQYKIEGRPGFRVKVMPGLLTS